MVFLQSLYYVLSISSRSLFLMMMMMMMMINLVFAGPTGLSLKLIHRDSPESPLYPGNLTQLERMQRAFQQSIDREQRLTTWMQSSLVSRNNNTNSKSLDTARPQVSITDGLSYIVQIGIGSFANPAGRLDPMFYYLFMDTGSDLLWLQCEGTNTVTFRSDSPPFDWQKSLTYHALPAYSPHPFCRKYGYLNEGGFCGYNVRYTDGASTAGILAIEKLTLNANYGLEVIDNFVFGCGLRQNEPSFGKNEKGQNPIAGILGLGGGIESFTRQLGDHVENKFEYCLKPWYDPNPANTSLRFGTDTKIVVGGQGVQTTSLIPMRGDTVYYATMEGISVATKRVFYPEGSNVFATRPDGTGGCIFDSGCPLTQLSTQVYDPLKNHLRWFFYQNYNIQETSPLSGFELCFERPYNFNTYPNITFHYTGADFVIDSKAAFYETDKVFCLVIVRTKFINSYSVVLGAVQQVNHRILHNLGSRKISWASENCAMLG